MDYGVVSRPISRSVVRHQIVAQIGVEPRRRFRSNLAVQGVKKRTYIGWCGWLLLAGSLGAAPAPTAVRWALGQIETGASHENRSPADEIRGRNHEVSRYQILPKVWRQYTRAADFTDPSLAWSVAQRILNDRSAHFRSAAGREADAFDLYVLWNAPGQYANTGFDRARLHGAVAKRAQRFADLVSGFAGRELRAQN